MIEINLCGKKACCPVANITDDGKQVILTEKGTEIKLTFEQVGKIYKNMCVNQK